MFTVIAVILVSELEGEMPDVVIGLEHRGQISICNKKFL